MTAMRAKVILLELNEVPWRIVDDFTSRHPRSQLSRLLPESRTFTTLTADTGHLSPWTTWPTLHRGVNDERHMIGSFGQDHTGADLEFPPIWTILHEQGVSVGICNTMHSYPVPDDMETYSFYLPDAFASEPVAHPKTLADFQRLNLTMSRESARNVDPGLPRTEVLNVLAHSVQLGIRPSTYATVASQLVAERRSPWKRNRRRTIQSLLLADLFLKQLRRTMPSFSSFFTNHVASAMHRYWAAAYPDDYEQVNLDGAWLETYCGEIDWAMQQADSIVGRIRSFVDAHKDYQLWIASSMGQHATHAQPLETQVFLQRLPQFMAAVGLPPDHGWEQRPAMLPQCNVQVDAAYVDTFDSALRGLRIGGAAVNYKRTSTGYFSMLFGQNNLHDQPDAVQLHGQVRAMHDLGLEAVEIEDRSDTTAYHVPEGMLAIYDRTTGAANAPTRRTVSVLSIAPALLTLLGSAAPAYMVAGDELV
jgi:hypothetical protein